MAAVSYARKSMLVLCGVLCAQAAQQEETATFKSKVNVVMVPVVVRDRQGRADGGLGKEDFELFDKGRRQAITTFSVERTGAGAPAPSGSAAGAPSAGAWAALPERFTAYLFDDVHLSFGDLARAREAASRHFDAALGAGDRAAIFSTSGRTMLDFTDDRAKLRETLLRLQPRPVALSGSRECPDLGYYQADLIVEKHDREALNAATTELMACESIDERMRGRAELKAEIAARKTIAAYGHEAQIALGVLTDVVRRMALAPGRRSIVLISPGFLTPTQLDEKTRIIDRAIRSGVVVSALDARGLYTTIPGGDASQQTYTIAVAQIKETYARATARLSGDVMAELAEGTGGTFFENSNDLEGGLGRIAGAPETIYVLGFSPQNLKLDGSFHKLKVALKDRRGLSVQARRGYYESPQVENEAGQRKVEIEEALFSREEVHDLPIEMRAQFTKPGGVAAKINVLARIDLTQVRFHKVDGRDRSDLTITSGLFDRNGNYVTSIQRVLTLQARDRASEAAAPPEITVRTSFNVKPGAYAIRLVVRDTEGQLMSAQNGAIEIQ